MKRVHILVEGQTEETLVRDVLGPHLSARGIYATSVVLKTKRLVAGGAFRGGATSTRQVIGDIKRLLTDTSAEAVTTMIDYYGLPDDFPGMSSRPVAAANDRVSHVERALAGVINDRRFLPHLTLHELEAWVFVDPAATGIFDAASAAHLTAIRDTAGGPERINDGRGTSPSKRVAAIFPGYEKKLHGPLIVQRVGLTSIAAACPHAASWLRALETL